MINPVQPKFGQMSSGEFVNRLSEMFGSREDVVKAFELPQDATDEVILHTIKTGLVNEANPEAKAEMEKLCQDPQNIIELFDSIGKLLDDIGKSVGNWWNSLFPKADSPAKIAEPKQD